MTSIDRYRKRIAKAMREARERAGVSLRQAARDLGWSHNRLRAYEDEELGTMPPIDEALHFASMFGLTLHDLIAGKPDPADAKAAILWIPVRGSRISFPVSDRTIHGLDIPHLQAVLGDAGGCPPLGAGEWVLVDIQAQPVPGQSVVLERGKVRSLGELHDHPKRVRIVTDLGSQIVTATARDRVLPVVLATRRPRGTGLR